MYSVQQPATNSPGILPDQQVAAGSAAADAIGLGATNRSIPKTAGRRLWKTLAGQFASALSSKQPRQEGMPLQEKDSEQLDAAGTSKQPQQQQRASEPRALRPRGRDLASLHAERDMLLNGVKSSVQKRRAESYRENAKTRVLSKRVPAEGTRVLKKGTRELTSLLEGWEHQGTPAHDAPPTSDTPSGRKRRRTVLEASHKVQRSLQDSADLEELAAKRAAAAAAATTTPAAATTAAEEPATDISAAAAEGPLSAPQTATGRPRRAAAEDCLARTAALAMEYDSMDFSGTAAPPARQQQQQPQPQPPRQRVSSGGGGGSSTREPPRTPHAGLPPIPPPTDPLNLPADVLDLMASVFREPGDRRWACRRILRTGILEGQHVEYRRHHSSAPVIKGVMTEMGYVKCFCQSCNGQAEEMSPLLFEEHAGSANRKPLDHMFLTGTSMSIKAFCMQGASAAQLGTPGGPGAAAWQQHAGTPGTADGLRRQGRPPKKTPGGAARVKMMAPTPKASRGNQSFVRNHTKNKRLFIYGSGADLQDGEPVSYVSSVGGPVILTGTIVIRPNDICGIHCDHCNTIVSASQFEHHAGRGQRRAPYDNIVTAAGETLRQVAARMPDDVDYSLLQCTYIASGARRSRPRGAAVDFGEPEIIGGCCICTETDFTPPSDGFDDRTIIICDQCELEHHVGCLRTEGRCDLKALPEGEWLCSEGCRAVHDLLKAQVAKGPQPIPGDLRGLDWVVRRNVEGSTPAEALADMQIVQEMLEESFDPIIDMKSNTDLLPIMCTSGSHGEWDYSGMHCVLLRSSGIPVVAAVVRVFGTRFAELPLIATDPEHRRQGYCRQLLGALVEVLASAGVTRLCLPAATESVGTWKFGFGFQAMDPQDVEWASSELRMLRFPGSEPLQLEIVPGALSKPVRPEGWLPPSARPKEPTKDAKEASGDASGTTEAASDKAAAPAADDDAVPPTSGSEAVTGNQAPSAAPGGTEAITDTPTTPAAASLAPPAAAPAPAPVAAGSDAPGVESAPSALPTEGANEADQPGDPMEVDAAAGSAADADAPPASAATEGNDPSAPAPAAAAPDDGSAGAASVPP